ncbi:MAG: DUF1822 family protein [Symploca sp. SIO2D2]|nr:DUF1822 family protein [Symploca sp. SIO2D2]
MTKTQKLTDWSVPMPITQEVQRIAQSFAREQPTPSKAQQIYFNTLAVCSVNNYLKILGIPTDLSVGNSWNPVVRLAEDTADLRVTGLGDLECRPVKPGDLTCHIPQEAWFDRIGYVAVEIDEDCTQATILGFSPTAGISELPLQQLRSLKDFPAYLNQLQPVVKLSQWFEEVVEAVWQTLEAILTTEPTEPALSFRDATGVSVERCKQIELEEYNQSVVMVITLIQVSEPEIDIMVGVYPKPEQIYLPPNLQVMLLDEEENTIMNIQGQRENKNMQLEFSGEPGDCFSIKVVVDEFSVTEDFII